MQISSDLKAKREVQSSEVSDRVAKTKTPDNGMLKGEIIDIQNGSLKVKLESGEIITAKLDKRQSLGETKIGDMISLKVNEENGTKTIEILISKNQSRLNILLDILKAAGLKPTEQNFKMVNALVENELPVNAKMLQKFNQAFKLTENMDKALFMIKNEINLTPTNAAKVDSFINHQDSLKNQIVKLMDSVENLKDIPLKEQVLNVLTGKGFSIASGIEPALPQLTATESTPPQHTTAPAAPMPTPQQQPVQTFTTLVNAAPTENMPKIASQPTTLAPQPTPIVPVPLNQVQMTALLELSKLIEKAPLDTAKSLPKQFAQVIENLLTKVDSDNPIAKELNTPEDIKQALKTVLENTDKSQIPQIIKEFINETDQKEIVNNEKKENTDNHKDPKKLAEHLTLKLNEGNIKELDDFFKSTVQKLTVVAEMLAKDSSPEANEASKNASQAKDNIDFLNNFKNHVFVQIPLTTNDAELYVFKDKSAKKNKSGPQSALVALDTLSLGHFETYIQKTDSNVNCQFRLENDEIVRLVKANLHTLSSLLKNKGYNLNAFSFITSEEKFSLLDAEPDVFDHKEQQKEGKKIAFDIRA